MWKEKRESIQDTEYFEMTNVLFFALAVILHSVALFHVEILVLGEFKVFNVSEIPIKPDTYHWVQEICNYGS